MSSISTFGVKSELDLFTTKPMQSSIESGQFIEYRPIASITDSNSPLEFLISGDDSYALIDLASTKIELRAKILREDGTPLKGDEDTVCPINKFLDSLFEHVSIELNGHTITPPSNLYHYRSIFENILSYSREAQTTHLSAGLFYKDEHSKMNDVDAKGFKARKNMLKEGVVELSSYIHSDLLTQDKFLFNNVSVRIKFFRNKIGFILQKKGGDENNYRVDILDAVLLVRKMKISPSVVVAHEKTLTRSNMKYPINRVEVKAVSISKDTETTSLDNIIIGEWKRRREVGGKIHIYNFRSTPKTSLPSICFVAGIQLKPNTQRIQLPTLQSLSRWTDSRL